MRALLLAILMTACGPTSYSKATSSRELNGGRYMITVHGNSRTTSDIVLEYTDRRAMEICPNGYDVVQKSGGVETVGTVNQSTGVVALGRRTDQSTIVQCR